MYILANSRAIDNANGQSGRNPWKSPNAEAMLVENEKFFLRGTSRQSKKQACLHRLR